MIIKNESIKENKKLWQLNNSIDLEKFNDSNAFNLINNHLNNKSNQNNKENVLNNNFINNKQIAPITPITPNDSVSVNQINKGNIENVDLIKNEILNKNYSKEVNLDKCINHDINKLKNNNLNNFDQNLFDDGNYLKYIWSDVICCKRKLIYHIKAIRTILSFKNILELSMDNSYKKLSKEESEK